MKKYKEIHIWNFPQTLIFVRLNDGFRKSLIDKLIKKLGNEPIAVKTINTLSRKHNIKRSFSRGVFYTWRKGFVANKGVKITKNIPLWVLTEISQILSNSSKPENIVMKKIESNVKYYCSIGGANRIYNPKLPIKVTPEFTSIIFNFCGDGHLAVDSRVSSSYRQLNEETLRKVYNKLRNCFGKFRPSLNDGKLYIPKSIAAIYSYIFSIKHNRWYNAYIPKEIKKLPKDFLVAGLTAFMIDEANIGEIIEIYSKNLGLLNDIREIAIKCGYQCRSIKKKYRYGIFDSYRFLISSESYSKLHEDIVNLKKEFPLCDLSHKNDKFLLLVKRKERRLTKGFNGMTRKRILRLLKIKPRTITELARILIIGHSSIRELLWKLEKGDLIKRTGRIGRNVVWAIRQI